MYRNSGGKPFGDGDRDKWYLFGAAGAIAFLATIAFWEMGYKEITWKDFVHRYKHNNSLQPRTEKEIITKTFQLPSTWYCRQIRSSK